MKCKSCFAEIPSHASTCHYCGITNPGQQPKLDKKWLMAAVVVGFIVLVAIPMFASFTWIR